MKKRKKARHSNSRAASTPKKNRSHRTQSTRSAPSETAEGSLKMHRDGYGFVLAETQGAQDVFVPRRMMGDAMDGDRVQVSVRVNARDGRKEGEILKILSRGTEFLVGEFKKIREQNLVSVAQNGRVMEFVVPPKKTEGAANGQSVGIKILRHPEGTEQGLAEIIKVFLERGSEQVELEVLILEHQLPREFPAPAIQEARDYQQNPAREWEKDRVDLRQLPIVTIDGETAKDFDDAILVRREGANFRLWVSIADVSFYVRPGTALDQEAYRRGTSVYFPGTCIPMLPEELSNDLCSLRPHEDRLSFTAELLLNSQGHPIEEKFYRSVIQSQGRLTYRQVARALIQEDPEAQAPIAPLLSDLREALTLSRIIRKARFARGSIDFDLPEPEIILNLEEGNTERIVKAERNEAHFMIEEFMIAANEAVARFIAKKQWPSLYRVHGEPDPEKVRNFQTLLHNLGFKVKFPKNPTPKFFNEVLKSVEGHSEAALVQHMLLRTMKQAVYSRENLGHFGLGSTCYTHFTSPIRRYPDLVVHRVLGKILSGAKTPTGKPKDAQENEMEKTASHSSRRERIAMEAEWESVDLKVALFMKQFLGQGFKGRISRITKFGFFVELQEFFVEGLVRLEEIEDDYYLYDETKHRLRGRKSGRVFKIGTEVNVTVAKVSILERQVFFTLTP